MGPLAPNEIISENTNFLLAFFIGIAFGWVLESSGFSSSRKLAGIFYGYDAVVLKVFFTGAITAMLGLLFMSLFGWIDLDLVYVNPTYLTSAIFCGAAIGKIDAMVFIGGLFIGVYGFAFTYPWWEKMYMAKYLGEPKISTTLGMSDGMFGLLLIIAALGMFFVAEWAEKKFPREAY